MRKALLHTALTASVSLAGMGCQPSPDSEGTSPTPLTAMPGVPTFRVDPDWPQVPARWRLGEVSSIGIDARDNAWFLHRPWTLAADEAHLAAPQVLGFDSEGTFLTAWGGAGEGYEWPQREHGLHIDHQGFVWLGGLEEVSVADISREHHATSSGQ